MMTATPTISHIPVHDRQLLERYLVDQMYNYTTMLLKDESKEVPLPPSLNKYKDFIDTTMKKLLLISANDVDIDMLDASNHPIPFMHWTVEGYSWTLDGSYRKLNEYSAAVIKSKLNNNSNPYYAMRDAAWSAEALDAAWSAVEVDATIM